MGQDYKIQNSLKNNRVIKFGVCFENKIDRDAKNIK